MLTFVFHLFFAAALVVLVWASARRDEATENLIRGLDMARKLDAEALRLRMARMQEDQVRHHADMLALLAAAERAVKQSRETMAMDRTGKGHGANGHKG